ncbi:MAG TPA: hypothetical protein VMN81_03400, partial [Vicinamibacterales bacterium]|nr:hypothetical protein [Vicinamibacterales bacterium]
MRRLALLILISTALAQTGPAAQPAPAQNAGYIDAYTAWDEGHYVVALERLKALLPGADEATFEHIALLTGELYQTHEVTADGRNPSLSLDGTLIAYETGSGGAAATRIVRNAPGFPLVVSFTGTGAVIGPTSKQIAYRYGAGRMAIRNVGAFLGDPIALTPGGASAAVWSTDGAALYFIDAPADAAAQQVFSMPASGGAARPLTTLAGRKSNLRLIPGGAALLFTTGGGGGRGGGQATPQVQSYIDLRTGEAGVFEDASTPPVFSADGGTLAYIARDGGVSRLRIRSGRAPATTALETTDRIDAPALSPDGSRVAFQRMLRDDWEIFVSDREGKDVRRVTREIQHDLLPRFLTNDRLFALVGEARHRRSHVYDLTTGTGQRVFHNNTIRTIAPEYIWQTSQDGARVLIQADRDGNTVSPERGVYVVDLTKKISRADLSARIDAMLEAERGLRAFAARVTRPLDASIRQIVDSASVSRVYGYEKALF